MRTVVALVILATSVMLAGCFHHRQAVSAEPLYEPRQAPIK
jgi:uncharacterized lipoprotein YajG